MEQCWVYDFDKTIYDGDSSIDFFKFCLQKKWKLLKYLPVIFFYKILYALKKISIKKYQEQFFTFLKEFDNIDDMVDLFWKKNKKKIKLFFLEDYQKKLRPIIYIISISPNFLLNGYVKNLKNVYLIATDMNKKTGVIKEEISKEKIRELTEKTKIEKFYFNSINNMSLTSFAKMSYIVIDEKITNWENDYFVNKKYKNNTFFLFLFFITFYVLLGIFLSYFFEFTKNNVLFEADTVRVFNDLSNILENHYRLKVHPLFVLFISPFIHVLNGITLNSVLSAIILSSFISSLSVVFLYKIATMFIESEKTKILIVSMFGFSFSYFIYTAGIETYNFAAFFLILLWYYVIKIIKNNECTKYSYFYLLLLGIASIAITITNYIIFLITSFVLWLSKKINLKKIFLLNIGVILVAVFLSLIQNYVWHNTPTLLEYSTNYSEEKYYTNFDVTFSKIQNVVQGLYINSIVATDVYLKNEDIITFKKDFSINLNLFPILFFYLSLIYFLYKNISKNKILNIGLLLALFFNTCLHLFYGNEMPFLYSCHFIYILFLLYICNYNSFQNKRWQKIFTCLFTLSIVIEIIQNIKIFRSVLIIVSKIFNANYYRSTFNGFYLLFGCLLLILFIYLFIFIFCKSLKKIKKASNEEKAFYVILCIFAILAISLIFISIYTTPHYWKIFNIIFEKK